MLGAAVEGNLGCNLRLLIWRLWRRCCFPCTQSHGGPRLVHTARKECMKKTNILKCILNRGHSCSPEGFLMVTQSTPKTLLTPRTKTLQKHRDSETIMKRASITASVAVSGRPVVNGSPLKVKAKEGCGLTHWKRRQHQQTDSGARCRDLVVSLGVSTLFTFHLSFSCR